MFYIYELLEQVSNLIETPATKKIGMFEFSLFNLVNAEHYQILNSQQLANLWDNFESFFRIITDLDHSKKLDTLKTNKEFTFQQWLAMQDFVNQDIDTILNNWNTYQEN